MPLLASLLLFILLGAPCARAQTTPAQAPLVLVDEQAVPAKAQQMDIQEKVRAAAEAIDVLQSTWQVEKPLLRGKIFVQLPEGHICMEIQEGRFGSVRNVVIIGQEIHVERKHGLLSVDLSRLAGPSRQLNSTDLWGQHCTRGRKRIDIKNKVKTVLTTNRPQLLPKPPNQVPAR